VVVLEANLMVVLVRAFLLNMTYLLTLVAALILVATIEGVARAAGRSGG
jgi:hypothetical protein